MSHRKQADPKGRVTTGMGRREFLAVTAAASATVIKPSLVAGSQANSTIELGIIGCGGRGSWIAKLFQETGKYKFVACADYFQDRIDKFGQQYEVDPARRYPNLSCYKRLLEGKLDAVVIESPPYAHPEHAMAAVEAGKHVYVAKPIAVDVPGCNTIAEAGKKATAAKQVFLVDFQTRANPIYREAAKRVHQGDIGQFVCAQAEYLWEHVPDAAAATPEEKLRHWYSWEALSGDFIVEQNIHALDVATWLLDAAPTSAVGSGGRKIRRVGNIYDHFVLTYHFPDKVALGFVGLQGVPGTPGPIHCRVYGTEGTVDTDYFGEVWIHGKKPYPGGKMDNLYSSGAVNNIQDFHRFITEGYIANKTVAPSVRSNLTAILGREAAYRGGVRTWDEMMKDAEQLKFDTAGLKS